MKARATAWSIQSRYRGALLCLLGTTSLYLLTIAPTVQSFDSAELTVGAYALGFVHPPGYPLYLLIGHLFAQVPIGDVGLRLNLLSVTFGILSVMMLYHLLFLQTHDWVVSLISAWLFASAPIFWSQAIRAEVYTLHAFLIISTLLAWWYAHHSGRLSIYVICFILLGLGMGNHSTTALLWLSILVCMIWETTHWRIIGLGASVLGLVIMAVCYAYFPLQSRLTQPIDYIRPYFAVSLSSVTDLIWLISGQAFKCYFYLDVTPSGLATESSRWVSLIWDNSLGIGIIFGILGWRHTRKMQPGWNRLLSLYFVTSVMAFFFYHVVDKEAMFIPLFIVGNVWVAQGIKRFITWAGARWPRLIPPRTDFLIRVALLLIIACGVLINWPVVSLNANRRVYFFGRALLDQAQPSAMIINHWVTASVLDYLQVVEHRRSDITSFNLDFFFLGKQAQCDGDNDRAAQTWFSWLKNQVGQRPLCFIEPLPPIPTDYHWRKQDMCWMMAAN
jgi:hypothetical protein